MHKKLDFKQYNFCLINFDSIFQKKIDTDLVNDLHRYNLLKDRITSDARKFFYHYIILRICETLLNEKSKEKSIIYFNISHLSEDCQIFKHFKEEEILRVLNAVALKIKKLLPVRIYISPYSFDFFTHLIEKKDGRGVELVNNIRCYLESVNFERYTFSCVKTFTMKNNLTFLNQTYFNHLKTKQLLIV